MYLQYFGLSRVPFSKEIEVKELYQSGEQKEAIARMEFTIREAGIGLILGEVGSGKTTVLRVLYEKTDKNRNKVIYTVGAGIGKSGFFKDICNRIGIESGWHFFDTFLKSKDIILKMYEEKKMKTILIVDEIQKLSYEMLEMIRLFSNYEMESKSPMSIIMAGQNYFSDKIRLTGYQALNQRISVRFTLKGLNLSESIEYIKHHMKIAGCSRAVFEDDAMSLIYEVTRGIPRKINNICSRSLHIAATEEKEIVGKGIVQRVLKDFDGVM